MCVFILQLLCDTPSRETMNLQEAPVQKRKKRERNLTREREREGHRWELKILTKLSALRCGFTSALAAGEETRKQPYPISKHKQHFNHHENLRKKKREENLK